ncbi:MAG TPA: hypothetical protein VEJ84_22700 [Acidimicrobiales bacterium]|nr:hypothetical protein [Acidimicrobiales bacterium]
MADLEALVALAAGAFFAGALTGADFLAAAFLGVDFATAGAAFFAGLPAARVGALVAAATAFRPVVLAGALTAFVARPEDAFAAAFAGAAFFEADFLVLRSALKPVAGLKRMPLDAAIFTGWPVLGLRPVRALREVGLKLPKP